VGDIFNATIQSAHKANSLVTIQRHQSIAATNQKITLGISLLKNAVRLEWLFEKATEMGIYQIVPIICERTIHERFKMDRMQNILQSAMIQSQQAWLPLLCEPIEFDAFIHKHKASVNLIAHCEHSEKKNIKEILAPDAVNLLIGPEGDFSSSEIATAISNNYTPIQLGPTRLRTETAGIFALSVLKIF
jgi:16S rRNA (uracil1498-N3)-methyltransferase